jgi:RNA-directed DNA polymerase
VHRGKVNYIVEADIRWFFDNIDHEWMLKMLKERIDDGAFFSTYPKMVKSRNIKDGGVINPITGCPQGGIISPVIANIYLHYALDLWFERVVSKNCRGQAFLIRYADDYVCAFQYEDEARRFYNSMGKRLGKFGLELAEEKAKVIYFCRFRKEESERFYFFGFEFYWSVGRTGRIGLRRRTSRMKLSASLMNFTDWIKSNRSVKIQILMEKLNAKLRGYWKYYGVI